MDTSATLQAAADAIIDEMPELEQEALRVVNDLPSDASDFDRGVAVGILLASHSERIAESVERLPSE